MRVEIRKIGKDGTELYINGVKYGEHITKYEIIQNACDKPTLILYCTIDELGFECDDVVIKKHNIKKNNK